MNATEEICKQIIYLESDDATRDTISMELEGAFHLEATCFKNGSEVIEYLSNSSTTGAIEMIIGGLNKPDSEGGDFLYRYVKKHHPNIPYLLHSDITPNECSGFGSYYKDHSANHWSAKSDTTAITQIVADMLHIKEVDMRIPQYCKVAIKRFLRFTNLASDIFIRLSKDKFIKIINADDEYSED